MSTPVLEHEPAHHQSVPARRPADCGQLLRARTDALFTSDLSAQCEHTDIEVAAAIRHAIAHNGIRGCAGEVAAAYGEHPETAARRMRWARAVVEGLYTPADAGGNAGSADRTDRPAGDDGATQGRGTNLVEQGYVHARFGGVPVLVGPELAAQLKAIRPRQP